LHRMRCLLLVALTSYLLPFATGTFPLAALFLGLAIFDAPVGEVQSKWVIDAAKTKYPGKPIKYLILTHHHIDQRLVSAPAPGARRNGGM
jgi:glyoxylase-like metal-dependent hydrolase (beta-lactamase superfamily II)